LRFCPIRQNGSAKYRRLASTQQTCSGVTNAVEEPKKGVEDLLKIAKGCLISPEAKQKFFNGLVAKDFV